MMKGQKGLSALVIVIIAAVVVAILLFVVLMVSDDQPKPVDEQPATTEPTTGTEQPPPEAVMVPMEELPAEYIEFLEQAFPDLIEYYSESGVPMELVWELERMIEE